MHERNSKDNVKYKERVIYRRPTVKWEASGKYREKEEKNVKCKMWKGRGVGESDWTCSMRKGNEN